MDRCWRIMPDAVHHVTVITQGDTELAPVHQCNVGMYSEYSHTCLWKITCMTSFVRPKYIVRLSEDPLIQNSLSRVLMETKGYQGLLLIDNRNKELALSEHMKAEDCTRVQIGLSLAWKASLATAYEDSFLCNRPCTTLVPSSVYINRRAQSEQIYS